MTGTDHAEDAHNPAFGSSEWWDRRLAMYVDLVVETGAPWYGEGNARHRLSRALHSAAMMGTDGYAWNAALDYAQKHLRRADRMLRERRREARERFAYHGPQHIAEMEHATRELHGTAGELSTVPLSVRMAIYAMSAGRAANGTYREDHREDLELALYGWLRQVHDHEKASQWAAEMVTNMQEVAHRNTAPSPVTVASPMAGNVVPFRPRGGA